MKVVRPYSGPNSYDFRERDGVLSVAVGCFDCGPDPLVAIDFYSGLLSTLAGAERHVVVQFQSHRWQRSSDERRFGGQTVLARGREWLAAISTTEGELSSLTREFWAEKELRFFAISNKESVAASTLEAWYRSYFEEFDRAALRDLGFAAEEVWGERFLLLRSIAIPLSALEEALSSVGSQHSLVFSHNREPFVGHFDAGL